ncbi:hypothetical protein BDN71DRAFT_1429160 [Pleurotus eryngii]|uniref:Uncharacterized protein n=1 Tax=Pleurotus eryngii TaxID=5323 RepID=A0A9P6A594_PLEER|nr:hypothetical protein BDN71DRAFT_1429160 [Pleurotus eryngii]
MKEKVEQSNPTRLPMMGEGDVDTTVLWEWFNKAENFFCHKSIAAENKVVTVAYGMSRVQAIHWLSANTLNLESMIWEDYKTYMRMLFLASDWEHSTCMDVLHIQQGSKTFMEFSLEMMGRNNLLAASSMTSFFATHSKQIWTGSSLVNAIEKTYLHCRPSETGLTRSNVSTNVIDNDWRKYHVRSTVLSKVPGNALTAGSMPFMPIPKLLDLERTLLSNNSKCYKCRKFWAGHDVLPHPANYASHGGPAPPVAAIIEESSASLIDVSDDAVVKTPQAIATVLPNVSSVVMDGCWSDDEYAPFSSLNIFWFCPMSRSC